MTINYQPAKTDLQELSPHTMYYPNFSVQLLVTYQLDKVSLGLSICREINPIIHP